MSKVAIITGAATGMGKGIAISLAKKSYKVIILDWNHNEGQKVADSIGGDFIKVDVTSWAQQFNAFDQTFLKYGRIDFVHANAGISEPIDYTSVESTAVFTADTPPNLLPFNVDLIGVIYSSLLALRYFRQNPKEVQDSLLLMTSSGIGLYPGPAAPIYAAAKHGVTGLARSLAARWKEEGNGFRCNALVPGLVLTDIMPAATRKKWADKGINTTVDQIVDGVNDMLHSDKSGLCCEVSGKERWYREPPEFKDDVQRKVIEEVCSWSNIGKEFEAARVTGEQGKRKGE